MQATGAALGHGECEAGQKSLRQPEFAQTSPGNQVTMPGNTAKISIPNRNINTNGHAAF